MATTKPKSTPAPTEFPYIHEGNEVDSASAAVHKTGDGLSEDMHFAPFIVTKGEKKILVLEVECTNVSHPWINKKNHELGTVRKHDFDASLGFFIDQDLIAEAVEKQRQRIIEFREAERIRLDQDRGTFTFDGTEGEDD